MLTALLYRRVSSSFLAVALYIFVEIAVLCVGIELLIRRFLSDPPLLTWSAVVLTACAIIAAALITTLSRKRLRNAVRRRLHFLRSEEESFPNSEAGLRPAAQALSRRPGKKKRENPCKGFPPFFLYRKN